MNKSSTVNSYLAGYNALSLLLWLAIFYQTLSVAALYVGHHSGFFPTANCIYISQKYTDYPHKLLVWVQAFNAFIEISNTLLGIVKSSVPAVILQFAARLLITVGITYYVPSSKGNFHFLSYTSLSLAWSLTEIIRYGFYLVKLVKKDYPYILLWLRYSAFFILYPVGLFSELYVVYLTLEAVEGTRYYWFLIFALCMYIPGFFKLYGYMIKQRKKSLQLSNTKKMH